MKKFLIGVAGLLSLIYLVYPSLGIFELIPDPIPFVGHVDEVTATMVLIWALRHFGVDMIALFGNNKNVPPKLEGPQEQQP